MHPETSRNGDVLLTAIAPAIWGSTYLVTTGLLPQGYPLTVAMLRALPAGLILLLLVRRLPTGGWWWRSFVLGALNFSIFWALLFVSAYRLPGGVAATVGAIQPLIVLLLALIKTMFFLRIFDNLSYLVTLIRSVIYDLRLFLVFYSILVFMFALILGVLGFQNFSQNSDLQAKFE